MYDRDLEHPDISDAMRWGYPRWMLPEVYDEPEEQPEEEEDDHNNAWDDPYYDDLEHERRH